MTAPHADDRIPISDESDTGDPTEYVTVGTLATYFLDLHERLSTAMTAPHADDRIPISDESDTGDPTEYVTVGTLARYFLDIHERIGTELTSVADDDRLVVSDESESGEPTKYVTFDNLSSDIVNAARVLSAIQGMTDAQEEDATRSVRYSRRG